MRTRSSLAVMCLAVALAGCAAATRPVPPCCYQGEVAVTRLADLSAVLEDGQRVGFQQLFPGYAPQSSLLTRALPFREALSSDIIYGPLIPLFPIYDANRDGRLEEPEVTVLYVREAGRAFGHPIAHLATDRPAWAIAAPTADIGGIVGHVEARRSEMDESGRQVFSALDQLGLDLLTRGSEGGRDRESFDFF